MTKRCCANCVYSYCSRHMRFSGFTTGFGSRPLCSNHPDAPGQLREVGSGGICRNYRAKPPAPAQPQGTIRRIALAHGQSVLVDAADYEWLSRHQWTVCAGYAARHENGRRISMHREIMKAPPGMVVDHIDGNKQNNCRSNLRICTPRENVQNRAKQIGSASRFKGVFYDKSHGKWYVGVCCNGQHLKTGYFDDEIEAARVYDRLAAELFGAFAYLNFPEDWPPERKREAYARKETVHALRKAKAERAKRRKAKGEKAKRKTNRARQKARRTPRPK